jgi:hypothetical protein
MFCGIIILKYTVIVSIKIIVYFTAINDNLMYVK